MQPHSSDQRFGMIIQCAFCQLAIAADLGRLARQLLFDVTISFARFCPENRPIK